MSLSKEDFLAFMKENKNDREKEIENLTTLVKEGVRDEVRDVVASLVTKQNSLEEKQNSLDDKQLAFEKEQSTLKTRVSNIESELAALKNQAPSSSVVGTFPWSRAHQSNHHTRSSPLLPTPARTDPNDPFKVAEKILSEAKKIIGFAPIRKSCLDYFKASKQLVSDDETMLAAISEFLNDEMKVPSEIVQNLRIKRIFPPRQLTWDKLYVEFEDQNSADFIWSFARNLRPGMKVMLWPPPQFYARFKAIDTADYHLRNGSEKQVLNLAFRTSFS